MYRVPYMHMSVVHDVQCVCVYAGQRGRVSACINVLVVGVKAIILCRSAVDLRVCMRV